MPAPAIDNAALPAIRPNAPAPNPGHAKGHSFRAALAAETDHAAPRGADPERPVEQTKAARPEADSARADDAPTHDDAPKHDDMTVPEDRDEDATVSQTAATDAASGDTAAADADAPAAPAGPKVDLSALAAMLAQLLPAPAQAQAHIPVAPAAATVVAPVTETLPAGPNAAADAPASGAQTAEPTAADPNLVPAAQIVAALPAPSAAPVAAPAQPQSDMPTPAEPTSTPAAAPDADLRPAAPIAEPAPIQTAETQAAQSAPTQPINEPADAPAPDRPREDTQAVADTKPTNAAPPPARHDAPRPMEQIRAETRPIAVEPAVNQIAIQVSRAVKDGIDQFDIDLKPDTLGRVTVRLEFASDTTVQAVFAAERPETLDLLKRDAREIARSLTDAGVRADAGSLSFSLHGNGNGGPGERQVPAGRPILFGAGDAIAAPAVIRATYARVGGVDIRI